jgi:hypothetical protein
MWILRIGSFALNSSGTANAIAITNDEDYERRSDDVGRQSF